MDDRLTFLHKLPLFADLSSADLETVCRQVGEVRLSPGELLFKEASLGTQAFVIQSGQIEIFKNSNGQEVQLAVLQPGALIGEMALLEATPRNASARALEECRLYVIGYEQLDHLLDTNPGAARTMLHTITQRLRANETLLHQSEKMAQLGTFTAGIAHELNNPSAAIQRAAGQLVAALEKQQAAGDALLKLNLTAEQVKTLRALGASKHPPAASGESGDALARADQEAGMEEWLDGQGVEEAWELAPILVSCGYVPADLQGLAQQVPTASLESLLTWLTAGPNLARLVSEIGISAGRMSEIIKALKTYTYLDQAPVQQVDIHAGLENTLVILRHKWKEGVEIQRQFDPALPRIQAYGSELNQVWTNLIDNAIDAMQGKGRLILRTCAQPDGVMVEVEDNGPGIPQEAQGRLFTPFFTTKPIGQGTGLGLNISYNIVHKHGGDIRVTSKPGETIFQVRLPLDFNPVRAGTPSVPEGQAAS